MSAGLLPLAYAMVVWLCAECTFRRPLLDERAWDIVHTALWLIVMLELGCRLAPGIDAFFQVITTGRAVRVAADAAWGSDRVDGFVARWVFAPFMDIALLVAWMGDGARRRWVRGRRGG